MALKSKAVVGARGHRRVEALPPIPMNTPEGARVRGIVEGLRAIDAEKGHAYSLQGDELHRMAQRLRVPVLFLAIVDSVDMTHALVTDRTVEDYRAWRNRLARKAVA